MHRVNRRQLLLNVSTVALKRVEAEYLKWNRLNE